MITRAYLSLAGGPDLCVELHRDAEGEVEGLVFSWGSCGGYTDEGEFEGWIPSQDPSFRLPRSALEKLGMVWDTLLNHEEEPDEAQGTMGGREEEWDYR